MLFTQTVHMISCDYYSLEEIEAWAPLHPDMSAWERYFGERYTLLMECDKGITGFGCLNPDGNNVEMLYTHHNYQSRGVGSAILEALEKEARRRGVKEIMLTTSTSAKNFYQKRGYKYHHNEKKKYGAIVFDCQILCKKIVEKLDINSVSDKTIINK